MQKWFLTVEDMDYLKEWELWANNWCYSCKGLGFRLDIPIDQIETCHNCNGSGQCQK